MATVIPANAIVRPRVVARDDSDSRVLEDVIADIVEEFPPGVVWLVGGPGSGKSTAIAHLAALFDGDDRLTFLDEPTQDEVDANCGSALIVASAASPTVRSGLVLRLLPWGLDDLAEYLLVVHQDSCNSVIGRLGAAARRSWTPQVARVVLERFVADPSLVDPLAALEQEIQTQLPKPLHFAAAAEFCLALLVGDGALVQSTAVVLNRIRCPRSTRDLLRHSSVQLPLAADRLIAALSKSGSLRLLTRRLPRELIELVGHRCRGADIAVKRLRGLFNSRRASSYQPMAASILRLADQTWKPDSAELPLCNLAGGFFERVDWPSINLSRVDLRKADFSAANLPDGNFEEADATGAHFSDASLCNARLIGVRASHADFRGARLVGAKLAIAELAHAQFASADLSSATLVKADLSAADLSRTRCTKADLFGAQLSGALLDETDFSDAKLDEANLAQSDLRGAMLQGACFENAVLTHAQLEDVVIHQGKFRRARLEYAHLTGSTLPEVDMRQAKLPFARLAEIDWPAADLWGADLHGASFHMGSSRSGLVGSPIACEGSKTGFYTDDREEMHFRRPEEIRKANLRGADLRRANVTNVDFYLVDLREALLDPETLAQARRTGAILDDWETG